MLKRFEVNDVVQFNDEHKWCGCIGIVREVKDIRIMVGIPIPEKGIAYIYCTRDDIEFIGEVAFVFNDDEEGEE